MNLWDFDELDEVDEKPAPPTPKSGRAAGIPSPRNAGNLRKPAVGGVPILEELSQAQEEAERIQLNVSQKRTRTQPVAQQAYPSNVGDEFDDLEELKELSPVAVKMAAKFAAAKLVVEQIVPETPQPAPPPPPEPNEFSPQIPENSVPVSLRPHLRLSMVESIALAALLIVLMLGSGVVYFKTIHHLQPKSERLQENHFPVKGEHLTITSAGNYWRAPIADGVNIETVRRGTQLVPVIDLTLEGGPAAIRILFRNSDGDVVGDAVTRQIPSGTSLEVAATAGFEDEGMHAAYRTGQGKLWTVQIYEAPSESSPGPAFKKLFEMNISTDRR